MLVLRTPIANNRQVFPSGGVPWRSAGVLHVPGRVRPAFRAETDSSASEAAIDRIQG